MISNITRIKLITEHRKERQRTWNHDLEHNKERQRTSNLLLNTAKNDKGLVFQSLEHNK